MKMCQDCENRIAELEKCLTETANNTEWIKNHLDSTQASVQIAIDRLTEIAKKARDAIEKKG